MDGKVKKICEALHDRNIQVVAERTSLSAFTIYRLINGTHKPNASTVKLLADYLRIQD